MGWEFRWIQIFGFNRAHSLCASSSQRGLDKKSQMYQLQRSDLKDACIHIAKLLDYSVIIMTSQSEYHFLTASLSVTKTQKRNSALKRVNSSYKHVIEGFIEGLFSSLLISLGFRTIINLLLLVVVVVVLVQETVFHVHLIACMLSL